MLSRAAATSAGSPSSGTTRASGMGEIHDSSGRAAPVKEPELPGGPKSMARARRWRRRSMSRQTLVAMR